MSKVNTIFVKYEALFIQSIQATICGILLTVNITTMQTEIETEEKHSLPRYATMPKSLYLSGDFGPLSYSPLLCESFCATHLAL